MIGTHLPHLSQRTIDRPGAVGLRGHPGRQRSARTPWPRHLSPWHKGNNLRQYLREWLYDGSDRKSPCQTQLDVTLASRPCSGGSSPDGAPAGWPWPSDRTLKGDQTTAIVISVVYRELRHPRGLEHPPRHPSRLLDGPHTVELLKELAPAVPHDMTVIVLCDRGISSPKPGRRYAPRAGIPVCATGITSPSAPTAASDVPARRFVSRPNTAGSDGTGCRHPQGQTPLHSPGGLVRPAGGTLDHPHRAWRRIR